MNIIKINVLTLVLGLYFLSVAPSSDGMTFRSQTLEANGHSIELQVPSGLQVEFLATLNQPRFLALGPSEELIIGSRGTNIYRMKKPYKTPEILVSLPGRNHSVVYRNGELFVAETAGLYSAAYTGSDTLLDPGDFALYVSLPAATGGHWSRTVAVGPDTRLFVGIGISGNCSDEYLDESYPFELRRGGVFVVDETVNPPLLTPYASGLRNPIGIAYNPETSVFYASNAGPDNLGYNLPPEVFSAFSDGSFHGMPWFQYYDGAFHSGECATSPAPRPSSEATLPSVTFEARSTPQGIAFVTNAVLGDDFNGNALVAIHGSWAVVPGGGPETRRPPKIVMVKFLDGRPIGVEDIITGFQRSDGSRFARPSGVLMGPDCQLYFTSDAGDVAGLFRLGPIPTEANEESVRAFVTRLYRLLLGREPDSAGLDSWVDDLLSGRITGCDIVFGFIFSPEFINRNPTDEEYVDILYQALFDREADIDGKNGWLDALQRGSREQVLDAFLLSQEFANLAASFGIIACEASVVRGKSLEAFVTRLYRLILGREPDSAGLDGWVDDLLSGRITGCDIAFGFIFSPEFIDRNLTNEEYVDILYQAFFNREADIDGKNGWLDVLQSGSREEVLDGFLFSQEFANLAAGFGIIACGEIRE